MKSTPALRETSPLPDHEFFKASYNLCKELKKHRSAEEVCKIFGKMVAAIKNERRFLKHAEVQQILEEEDIKDSAFDAAKKSMLSYLKLESHRKVFTRCCINIPNLMEYATTPSQMIAESLRGFLLENRRKRSTTVQDENQYCLEKLFQTDFMQCLDTWLTNNPGLIARLSQDEQPYSLLSRYLAHYLELSFPHIGRGELHHWETRTAHWSLSDFLSSFSEYVKKLTPDHLGQLYENLSDEEFEKKIKLRKEDEVSTSELTKTPAVSMSNPESLLPAEFMKKLDEKDEDKLSDLFERSTNHVLKGAALTYINDNIVNFTDDKVRSRQVAEFLRECFEADFQFTFKTGLSLNLDLNTQFDLYLQNQDGINNQDDFIKIMDPLSYALYQMAYLYPKHKFNEIHEFISNVENRELIKQMFIYKTCAGHEDFKDCKSFDNFAFTPSDQIILINYWRKRKVENYTTFDPMLDAAQYQLFVTRPQPVESTSKLTKTPAVSMSQVLPPAFIGALNNPNKDKLSDLFQRSENNALKEAVVTYINDSVLTLGDNGVRSHQVAEFLIDYIEADFQFTHKTGLYLNLELNTKVETYLANQSIIRTQNNFLKIMDPLSDALYRMANNYSKPKFKEIYEFISNVKNQERIKCIFRFKSLAKAEGFQYFQAFKRHDNFELTPSDRLVLINYWIKSKQNQDAFDPIVDASLYDPKLKLSEHSPLSASAKPMQSHEPLPVPVVVDKFVDSKPLAVSKGYQDFITDKITNTCATLFVDDENLYRKWRAVFDTQSEAFQYLSQLLYSFRETIIFLNDSNLDFRGQVYDKLIKQCYDGLLNGRDIDEVLGDLQAFLLPTQKKMESQKAFRVHPPVPPQSPMQRGHQDPEFRNPVNRKIYPPQSQSKQESYPPRHQYPQSVDQGFNPKRAVHRKQKSSPNTQVSSAALETKIKAFARNCTQEEQNLWSKLTNNPKNLKILQDWIQSNSHYIDGSVISEDAIFEQVQLYLIVCDQLVMKKPSEELWALSDFLESFKNEKEYEHPFKQPTKVDIEFFWKVYHGFSVPVPKIKDQTQSLSSQANVNPADYPRSPVRTPANSVFPTETAKQGDNQRGSFKPIPKPRTNMITPSAFPKASPHQLLDDVLLKQCYAAYHNKDRKTSENLSRYLNSTYKDNMSYEQAIQHWVSENPGVLNRLESLDATKNDPAQKRPEQTNLHFVMMLHNYFIARDYVAECNAKDRFDLDIIDFLNKIKQLVTERAVIYIPDSLIDNPSDKVGFLTDFTSKRDKINANFVHINTRYPYLEAEAGNIKKYFHVNQDAIWEFVEKDRRLNKSDHDYEKKLITQFNRCCHALLHALNTHKQNPQLRNKTLQYLLGNVFQNFQMYKDLSYLDPDYTTRDVNSDSPAYNHQQSQDPSHLPLPRPNEYVDTSKYQQNRDSVGQFNRSSTPPPSPSAYVYPAQEIKLMPSSHEKESKLEVKPVDSSQGDKTPVDQNLRCPLCMKYGVPGEIQIYRDHVKKCDGSKGRPKDIAEEDWRITMPERSDDLLLSLEDDHFVEFDPLSSLRAQGISTNNSTVLDVKEIDTLTKKELKDIETKLSDQSTYVTNKDKPNSKEMLNNTYKNLDHNVYLPVEGYWAQIEDDKGQMTWVPIVGTRKFLPADFPKNTLGQHLVCHGCTGVFRDNEIQKFKKHVPMTYETIKAEYAARKAAGAVSGQPFKGSSEEKEPDFTAILARKNQGRCFKNKEFKDEDLPNHPEKQDLLEQEILSYDNRRARLVSLNQDANDNTLWLGELVYGYFAASDKDCQQMIPLDDQYQNQILGIPNKQKSSRNTNNKDLFRGFLDVDADLRQVAEFIQVMPNKLNRPDNPDT